MHTTVVIALRNHQSYLTCSLRCRFHQSYPHLDCPDLGVCIQVGVQSLKALGSGSSGDELGA
jgi:hypothetical protein